MADFTQLLSRANKLQQDVSATSSPARGSGDSSLIRLQKQTANEAGVVRMQPTASAAAARPLPTTSFAAHSNDSMSAELATFDFGQSKPASYAQQGSGSHPFSLAMLHLRQSNTQNDQMLASSSKQRSDVVAQGDGLASDLETFLEQQRMATINSLINETLRNNADDANKAHWQALSADWTDYKQRLLSNTAVAVPGTATSKQNMGVVRHLGASSTPSPLSNIELIFAKQVEKAIDNVVSGGMEVNLCELITHNIRNGNDMTARTIWNQVHDVLSNLHAPPSASTTTDDQCLRYRLSPQFRLHMIKTACQHLQKEFIAHMESVVYGRMEQAQRGGIPGTRELASAFLNVVLPRSAPDAFWPLVYCCIRAGDHTAALSVTQPKASQAAPIADLCTALRHYTNSPYERLPADLETKLRLEYARQVRTSNDHYKIAVYCVLVDCTSGQPTANVEQRPIDDTFEAWLWMQLCHSWHYEMAGTPTQTNNANSNGGLWALQTQITAQCGEEHFRTSPNLYWKALWLTGQFELAIEFLWRTSTDILGSHAVHIALCTRNARLLLLPRDCGAKLLSKDSGDLEHVRRLNLARMLLLYVSKFDQAEPCTALDYMYCLRDMHTPTGENLFGISVGRLVRTTKEYSSVLGSVNEDCERESGAIDRYSFDVTELIEHVALECEADGDMFPAVHMYDLAQNHNKVLSILSSMLCAHVAQQSTAGSMRERVLELAEKIAFRYKRSGHRASDAVASTFYLLMDLGIFFDMYHSNQYTKAFQVVSQLRLLPANTAELNQYVNAFHMMTDEVRQLLGDILTCMMSMLCGEFDQLKNPASAAFGGTPNTSHQSLAEVRNEAQALIQYAGMLPHRFPASITARLVQLEARLH